MRRIKERTEDRVNPTSPLGVAAQVVAINRWGKQTPMDLASLTLYPDAGHGGLFQCHEQFVTQVRAFLG